MEHPDRLRTLHIRTQHLWRDALRERLGQFPLWSADQVVDHLRGVPTMAADTLCQQLAEQGFLLELIWGDELRYPAFMVAGGEVFEEMPRLLTLINTHLDNEMDRYLWLTQYQLELNAVPAELLGSREGRLLLMAFLTE
ncbi:hypothetical protein PVT67_15995 [Gallaecimonas kandeliae]|uniref:hypothetical protein n=1 Tax=Gallaecimonas kandeliae TaxID=3029055 RepID=UPI002647048A|nr:hypothetical protein [Gallaecimonas kandeliae]WKE65145.1 hypothetical protein PVT67_15995 [Gallaecimonas kandeliae]